MSSPASPASAASSGAAAPMTHRQVLEALSGLLLGMFVSMLAGSVVATSLPRIITDLAGDQTAYTWVITSTLLATTVSTPIWGKLADLFDRKLLIQLALVVFTLASAGAGFAIGTGDLIAWRVLQGLGGGGMVALSQVIMADIISPRERGRYMGLFGAVLAVATVGGPLLGGVVTDGIGWRWNFWVAIPFAAAALVLLQRTLHLPDRRRSGVRIDVLGALLLSAGVSALLIWVSLAGHQFAWASSTSALLAGGGAVLLIAALAVELRAAEPILPLSLFGNRTFSLAVIASIAVGTAMFGTMVFLGQYMQLARGASATEAGLLTLPLIAGLLVSSTVIGQLVTRTGRWKGFLIGGALALTAGLALLGTIHYDTPYPLLAGYMALLGIGIGASMQNLVLVVQNAVDPRELGVASSGVTFFRSLGGTAGVSLLGAVLAGQVAAALTARAGELRAAIAALGEGGAAVAAALGSGALPDVHALPDGVRQIIESIFGDATASVFLLAAPIALLSVIAVSLLPNRPLSRQTNQERLAELEAADPVAADEG